MSITLEQGETVCVIRLEGDIDVASSAELKRLLIEAISTQKELQVDLTRVTDLDVTAIQLLCAATREIGNTRTSGGAARTVPANIDSALREAGFENFLVLAASKPKPAEPMPQTESADD